MSFQRWNFWAWDIGTPVLGRDKTALPQVRGIRAVITRRLLGAGVRS